MLATANYTRIEQLGAETAKLLTYLSFYRSYATTKHHWMSFEDICQLHRYDVLEAFQRLRSTLEPVMRNLRACLHQASAISIELKASDEDRLPTPTTLTFVATEDAKVLYEKGLHYGDSWKQRGGVGGFMMAARKWDRIQNIVEPRLSNEASFSDVLRENPGNVIDDVDDLRRYLLLIEDEALRLIEQEDASKPQPHGYVDQDSDGRVKLLGADDAEHGMKP